MVRFVSQSSSGHTRMSFQVGASSSLVLERDATSAFVPQSDQNPETRGDEET